MSGFLTDPKFAAAVGSIIQQTQAKFCVETGTYEGDGAAALRQWCNYVYTIEIRRDFAARCAAKLAAAGVRQFIGSSEKALAGLLSGPEIFSSPNEWTVSGFFFLDAHWQDYWPLRDELKIINTHRADGLQCTVLVHDMFVPGRPNFAGCRGGGGTIGHELYGPRAKVDDTPCDYQTFAEELDKFPHWYWPAYPEGGMGYGIGSDFALVLGPEFEVVR